MVVVWWWCGGGVVVWWYGGVVWCGVSASLTSCLGPSCWTPTCWWITWSRCRSWRRRRSTWCGCPPRWWWSWRGWLGAAPGRPPRSTSARCVASPHLTSPHLTSPRAGARTERRRARLAQGQAQEHQVRHLQRYGAPRHPIDASPTRHLVTSSPDHLLTPSPGTLLASFTMLSEEDCTDGSKNDDRILACCLRSRHNTGNRTEQTKRDKNPGCH